MPKVFSGSSETSRNSLKLPRLFMVVPSKLRHRVRSSCTSIRLVDPTQSYCSAGCPLPRCGIAPLALHSADRLFRQREPNLSLQDDSAMLRGHAALCSQPVTPVLPVCLYKLASAAGCAASAQHTDGSAHIRRRWEVMSHYRCVIKTSAFRKALPTDVQKQIGSSIRHCMFATCMTERSE